MSDLCSAELRRDRREGQGKREVRMGEGRVLRVEERELLWQTTDGGELASKDWRRIQLAGTKEWQDEGGLAGKVDW